MSELLRWGERSWIVGLTLGCAVPLLAVTAVVLADSARSPLRSDAPVEPVIVPVGRGTVTGEFAVGLKVQQAAAATVASPAGGIITKLGARPSRAIRGGDTVVWIDDVARLGMVTDAPLVADVTPGARGPNVERAQRALRQAGVLDIVPDGKAGPATVAAIRALNTAIGRQAQGGTLSADTFVWLGPKPFNVKRDAVTVGSRVAAGDTLLVGPRRAAKVAVSEPEQVAPADGAYVIAVGDDATVPYDVGAGTVSRAEDVTTLAAALGSAEGVGTARLRGPLEVVTVPVSAVVTDETGATCVFPSIKGAPVAATPVGGGTSEVQLPSDFPLREVLANPRATRSDPRCS